MLVDHHKIRLEKESGKRLKTRFVAISFAQVKICKKLYFD